MLKVLAPLVAAAVLLGACGSDEKPAAKEMACRSNTPPTTAKALGGDADVSAEVAKRRAPEVIIPKELPTKLVVTDLIVGTGDELAVSDEATLQYTGVMASDCKEFDSTWSKGGEPATFTIGQLIPGWQQGLVGMKPGGRRLLIIPPDLAYGDKPAQAGAPSGTLGFVVDLISIGAKADAAALATVVARGAPQITTPDPIPTTTTTADDVVGDGPALDESSGTAIVMLVARQEPSGQTDSTWEGEPKPQRFDMAQLNPELKKAMLGMKVGGRRSIVLPAGAIASASSDQEPQSVIAVVDLVGIA